MTYPSAFRSVFAIDCGEKVTAFSNNRIRLIASSHRAFSERHDAGFELLPGKVLSSGFSDTWSNWKGDSSRSMTPL
jgi:hypothetical protein